MKKIYAIIFLSFIFLLNSCVTTDVKTYKKPNKINKKYSKILIEVDSLDIPKREYIEKRLCLYLKNDGISASPLIEYVLPTEKITEEIRNNLIVKNKLDGWIIIRLLSDDSSNNSLNRSMFSKVRETSLRSEFYDCTKWKCVWLTISKSNAYGNNEFEAIVRHASREIIIKMKKDGLI